VDDAETAARVARVEAPSVPLTISTERMCRDASRTSSTTSDRTTSVPTDTGPGSRQAHRLPRAAVPVPIGSRAAREAAAQQQRSQVGVGVQGKVRTVLLGRAQGDD
jgi:hypothetical protein